MKATVLKEKLQEKVSLANHGISSRSQLPVLLNIFLEAKDGKLFIKGTDLEIGIETHIPANIEEEGAITIPAKLFQELISSLDSEKITLQTEEKNLKVISNKAKSTLQTIEAEEFPTLYEEKGEKIGELQKDHISQSFQKVLFAASLDTTRPALSGIYIKQEDKGCLMVATDGYRLSLKKLPFEIKKNKEGEDKPFLIPARIIRELTTSKEEGNLDFYLSSNNNQIIFEQGDTLILGRMIDAQYPQYEKIIPSNFTTRAIIDKNELLKAVKLSSLFARDSSNIITFSVGKDKIELFAQTASLGENKVDIEAKVEGDLGEIAFNAKFLLDFLSHIDEDSIIFEMTGPLAPGVFKIEGDDSFLHLIMPIRVQNT